MLSAATTSSRGGGGADHLFGGEGKDTADYSDSNTGVQASIAAHGGSFGTAEGDKLYEIENLNGSQHDDILEGDKNANVLYGDFGNDVLKGGGGADSSRAATVTTSSTATCLRTSSTAAPALTPRISRARNTAHVNLETGYSQCWLPP